jgi:hypothetical protein
MAFDARALVIVALLLLPSEASAYCRTSTCGSDVVGALCNPEISRDPVNPPPDCGIAIGWWRPCIGFAVHEAASSQVPLALARELLTQAFASWQAVDCGGGAPAIRIEDFGTVACGAVEYNQRDGNVNVLGFRDDAWPHDNNRNALALTTVSFDFNTGEIFDADIEINSSDPAGMPLSTDGGPVGYDLLSILTHEAGHALGLAHSVTGDPPTMIPVQDPGSTDLRTLDADDEAGICAAYPPSAAPAATCNPVPRHGFASECKVDQRFGDCALGPGASAPRLAALALAAALAALLGLRRSRVRWSPRRRGA